MLQNKSLLQSHPSWSGYLSGISTLFQNKQTLLFLSVFCLLVFLSVLPCTHALICFSVHYSKLVTEFQLRSSKHGIELKDHFKSPTGSTTALSSSRNVFLTNHYKVLFQWSFGGHPFWCMPLITAAWVQHFALVLSGILFFSRWFLLLIFKYNVCSSPAFWISSVHLPNCYILSYLAVI